MSMAGGASGAGLPQEVRSARPPNASAGNNFVMVVLVGWF